MHEGHGHSACRIKDRERRRAEGEKLAPFGGPRHSGPPPPAHPFSVSEARNAGLLVELRRGQDSAYIMDNRRFVNGYEVRKLQARAVAELKDPPFQDVQHFVDVGVGGNAAAAQRTLLEAASAGTARQFAVGDTVAVAKGELTSMRGRVVEIDESRSRVVLLPVGLEGFTEKLDFDMSDLQKEVAMGARVKVRPPPLAPCMNCGCALALPRHRYHVKSPTEAAAASRRFSSVD